MVLDVLVSQRALGHDTWSFALGRITAKALMGLATRGLLTYRLKAGPAPTYVVRLSEVGRTPMV